MYELRSPGWSHRPSNKSILAACEPDSWRTLTMGAAHGARAERPMVEHGKAARRNCGSASFAKSALNQEGDESH